MSKAAADPVFDAKGFKQNRDYFTSGPNEHIDTLTGNVVLTYTDLVLPGNRGNDLAFRRTFNTKDGRWTYGISGMPFLQEAAVPGADPDFRPSFVDEFGAEHTTALIATDNTSVALHERWVVTRELWKYDRLNRILYLPDGRFVKYDAIGNPVWLRGPFGEQTIVSWQPSPTSPRATIRQCFDGGSCAQARVVTLQFAGQGTLKISNLPLELRYTTASGEAHVWSYTSLDGRSLTVTPPLGASWIYQYTGLPDSGSGSALTVTSPQGGVTRFEMEAQTFEVWNPPFATPPTRTAVTPVVKRKTVSGPNVTNGTWQYSYTPVSAFDATSYRTTITSPSNVVTTFEYNHGCRGSGFGECANVVLAGDAAPPTGFQIPADWLESPLLVSRDVANGLEHEQLLYRTPLGAPEVGRRDLTRDGRLFRTEYEYRGTDWADFRRPWRVTETGTAGRRVTTRTFSGWGSSSSIANLNQDDSVGHPQFASFLVSETVVVDEASSTVGSTSVTTRSFDPSTGFVSSETTAGLTTTFAPDSAGNVGQVTLGNGTQQFFEYQWGVMSAMRTSDVTVARVINEDGTTAAETRGGRVTSFYYDPLFRNRETRPPATQPVLTDYSPSSDTVTVTRGSDHRSVTHLDGFGRVIDRRTNTGDGEVVIEYAYDAEGRRVRERLPYVAGDQQATRAGTEFIYDALNRLTTRWHVGPDGQQRVSASTVSYGLTDVVLSDEDGRVTRQQWVGFGDPDDTHLVGVDDAIGSHWQYAYDVFGLLRRVIAPDQSQRAWTYQPGTRLLANESQPESGATAYDYDLAGNLRVKTDADGTRTEYLYDGSNRLRRAMSGTWTRTIDYVPNDDLREVTTSDGVTTVFHYDDAGHQDRRVDYIPGGVAPLVQTALWDDYDNLRVLTYPTGRSVTFNYDAASRVTGVTSTLSVTAGTQTSQAYAFDFHYHPSGSLSSYRTADGASHSFSYENSRYRLTDVQGANNFGIHYRNYDNAGNPRTIEDNRAAFTQTLTYDSLERLTGAQGRYGVATWQYDAHGNRMSAGGATYLYEANTLRLRSQNDQTFTYFANGNLKTGPYQGDVYAYNPESQLASAVVAGQSHSYRYDADGWRVAQTDATGTTLFARGPSGELLTEIQPGGVRRDYIYAGGRLLGMVRQTSSSALLAPPSVIPTQPSVSGTSVSVTFTAQAATGTTLASASLLRAPVATTCTPAATVACSWTSVAALSAPAGTTSWNSGTALVDTAAPLGAVVLYQVLVTDQTNQVGSGTPAQVQIPGGGNATTGTGLQGQYFNDSWNTAKFNYLVLTRTDPVVNFDWSTGSPSAAVQDDYFSVRWTGQVLAPVTGSYVFSTVSDDGVRLSVNGQVVIDNWTDHGTTTDSSQGVALVAGAKYSITMEFYEKAYGATARLLWAYPGQASQVIPQSQLFPPGVATNSAPVVQAGADQTVSLVDAVTLTGSATDDGGPSPMTLTWSQVSGPGTASFANTHVGATSVVFSASGSYTLRLTASDGALQSADDVVITVTTPATNTVTGLRGQYYNDPGDGSRFTTLVLTRTDPAVDFAWGSAAPAAGLQSDDFSVRWTGFVVAPVSGTYVFSTVSDDGVRFTINGQRVIDNWTDHAPTTDISAGITLVAGTSYPIILEFYERGGGANVSLQWTYPGKSTQVVPQSQFVPPASVSNSPPSVQAGADQTIGASSVASLVGTASDDGIPSVLTTTWSQLSGPGVTTFGNSHAPTTTATFSLPGTYVLQLAATDGALTASDELSVTVTATVGAGGTGLKGQYFNDAWNTGKFTSLALTRTDSTVNFTWGESAPGAGVQSDYFSVRWSGQVLAPVTGTYVFSTTSDDGVRLWVNGQLLVDNWTDHAATTDSGVGIALVAGTKYAITMEFYEKAYGATAMLMWAYPGQSQQVIPQGQLNP